MLYSRHSEDGALLEAWERRVLTGDFRGIPAKLGWKRSGKLAHFIDGYEIAGGQSQLIALMQAKREEYTNSGAISGSALELWLCLFAERRANYWAGGSKKN
jgi:hypothetical protein